MEWKGENQRELPIPKETPWEHEPVPLFSDSVAEIATNLDTNTTVYMHPQTLMLIGLFTQVWFPQLSSDIFSKTYRLSYGFIYNKNKTTWNKMNKKCPSCEQFHIVGIAHNLTPDACIWGKRVNWKLLSLSIQIAPLETHLTSQVQD